MQKKTWAILGGGCALLILIGVGLVFGIGYFVSRTLTEQSQRTDAESAVAVLRVERGSAIITTAGIPQNVASENETEVLTGDEIVVSDDGRAAIVWDKYGRTLLDAGTRLRVTEAERSSGNSLRARLLLDIGRTWTRLERLLDLDSEVSVGASNVVATVRGTSFGVERLGNDVGVKVTESSVATARSNQPFSQASFTAALELFESQQTVEAGHKVTAAAGSVGILDAPVPMTEDELSDPFLLAGDRELLPNEYDLSGWTSGAERWLGSAIEYLAWRPWLLAGLDFNAESFREFYANIPANVRSDIEARVGAPNFEEMERLLNW
jgi:hypothetical protein